MKSIKNTKFPPPGTRPGLSAAALDRYRLARPSGPAIDPQPKDTSK